MPGDPGAGQGADVLRRGAGEVFELCEAEAVGTKGLQSRLDTENAKERLLTGGAVLYLEGWLEASAEPELKKALAGPRALMASTSAARSFSICRSSPSRVRMFSAAVPVRSLSCAKLKP